MSFPEFDVSDELLVSAKQVRESLRDSVQMLVMLDLLKAKGN